MKVNSSHSDRLWRVVPGHRRVGLDPYLVLLSGRPLAFHSLPQSQIPAQGPSSFPPSEELEGWFGSSLTEGHRMELLVSCDCGKSKYKRQEASVHALGIGLPITCSPTMTSSLFLVESEKYLERPTVMLLSRLPYSLETLNPFCFRTLHWLLPKLECLSCRFEYSSLFPLPGSCLHIILIPYASNTLPSLL